MRIAVLFKVVSDPEGEYKIGPDGEVLTAGLPQIPSTFDEHAAEAAIQLKEAVGGSVVVVCSGPASAEPMIRRPLAMGADEAVLIETQGQSWDSLGAAGVLAAALRELGHFDVILCGREAADTSGGLVGPYVAQELGISFLTLATSIKAVDGSLLVQRPCDGGQDLFLCKPPVLLTVSNEANRPRMPAVMKMMQAKKIPIRRMLPEQLNLRPMPGSAARPAVLSRSTPSAEGNCTFIGGETPREQASNLLVTLRAERVV